MVENVERILILFFKVKFVILLNSLSVAFIDEFNDLLQKRYFRSIFCNELLNMYIIISLSFFESE